jgi:hypothetical protein
MNRFLLLVLSTALLAACGTAAGSSGSAGLHDTTSVGAVQVSQGTNAHSESDVNRLNPTITKGTRPAPVTPAQPPAAAPTSAQPPMPVDRCNGGGWIDHEAGNRSSTGSLNHPPLPACAVQ